MMEQGQEATKPKANLRLRKQKVRERRVALERAIAEHVDEGVVALDLQGAIVGINARAERLLQCSEREVLGQPLERFAQMHYAAVPLQLEHARLRAAIHGQEQIRGEPLQIELRNGKRVPVKGTIAPARRSGRAVGAVLMLEDLTEFEEAQSARRTFESIARDMLESVPVLAWTLKENGSVGHANDQWIRYTGLDLEQIKTTPDLWLTAFHPDDQARIKWLRSQGSPTTPGATEVRVWRASAGVYRWHLYRWSPIRDGQKQIIRTLSTCAELYETDRQRYEIVAMLESELRRALQPIVKGLRLLLTSKAPDREEADRIIRTQISQISALVDSLLDLAHVEAGDVVMDLTPGDLRPLLEHALERTRELRESKGHVLDVDIPDGSLPVRADPFRIEQAFVHLLQNAAMYTAAEGQLTVRVRREKEEVSVSVADNGPGIGPELRARLFLPFARGEDAPKSTLGLGVGLPLVREIVRRHGGTITIRSELDKGSEFTIRLPRLRAPSRSRPPSGGRALVVEDNPALAENLAKILRDAGQQVRVAYDGGAAIAEASVYNPDVVFLDMSLPLVTGKEAARMMRRQLDGPVLVGVLPQSVRRALVSDVSLDYYITKPAGIVDVRAVLAEVRAKQANAAHDRSAHSLNGS